jgi:hypothetical protein
MLVKSLIILVLWRLWIEAPIFKIKIISRLLKYLWIKIKVKVRLIIEELSRMIAIKIFSWISLLLVIIAINNNQYLIKAGLILTIIEKLILKMIPVIKYW